VTRNWSGWKFCDQLQFAIGQRRKRARVEMESEWRDVFVQKSIHDIREVVYDTRFKATAKKSELRTVVRYGIDEDNVHK
jgi:hypothetical protein